MAPNETPGLTALVCELFHEWDKKLEIVINVPKIQGQAEGNVRVLWDVISTCKGWRGTGCVWSARGGFGTGDQAGELGGTGDARTRLC